MTDRATLLESYRTGSDAVDAAVSGVNRSISGSRSTRAILIRGLPIRPAP